MGWHSIFQLVQLLAVGWAGIRIARIVYWGTRALVRHVPPPTAWGGTALSGVGVGVAIVLLFVDSKTWKIALAIALGATWFGGVALDEYAKRRARLPAADLGPWALVPGPGHPTPSMFDPRANAARAQWMADQLKAGLRYRKLARDASTRNELLDACTSFSAWALEVNEWVAENAPLHHADLTDKAPWAMQGKAEALRLMDERLRSHRDVARKLAE